MRTKTSIQALVKLLDDADEMVINHARSTLLEYGEEIIPDLKQLEDASLDNPVQMENVTAVLNGIRFEKIKNELDKWIHSREKNLLEAIYIISSYQYPDVTIEEFVSAFQTLKHRCWLTISQRQTSFEKMEVINKVFFEEFHFASIQKSYYSPFDIFVTSVLDSKEGTDLALGLIYSLVAQSLDIPLYGVASKNRRTPFMLAHIDKDNLLPILDWGIDNNGVLFYLDVTQKGLIISPQHLKEAFQEKGLPTHKAQFEPSPNTILVKHYLQEIRFSYENHAYYRYKLADIDELIDLF